jgi:hypothetical protein
MSSSPQAVLSHADSNLVTRVQLAALPPVVTTDTFKPVAHIELVKTLEEALRLRKIKIVREQFAINLSGAKLFGTLDLSLKGVRGSCASLGIRTANDKSMSIQIIAGMRIFVCDNLAFNGDIVCVDRRHTSGLDLIGELEAAVMKYERHYRSLTIKVENLKARKLVDAEAKAMIYDVFAKEAMPVRFFHSVGEEYFHPRHKEFRPRTAWSLHNSFTEVAKQMPLSTRIDATQEIGNYFGLMAKRKIQPPQAPQVQSVN